MVCDPAVLRAAGARCMPAGQHKPMVDIKIDGHFSAKVYTSGSSMTGLAAFRAHRDTPFDDLEIVFVGVAATRLDFVQQYPSHSFRPFVKLRMPIPPSALPESGVLEAGKTHVIPFNFVVPHQLTLGACTHHCATPAVREHHLRLPPTVGFWEADDQAPDMAHIEYTVRARAFRRKPGCQSVKLMEAYHMVKVLPAFPEDAPLDITFRDERYNLSKSKTIRKNLFSAKTGRLTATASQPGAVMLSADGHSASTTMARVTLEFAPTSPETPPPKMMSVSAKLASATFFGAAPTDLMPNLGSRSVYTANPSLSYMTSTSLFSTPLERVAWQQRNVSGRRDSGYSSLGLDDDASETDCSEVRRRTVAKGKSSSKCPIRHTAVLEIPFSIPTANRKLFLPTFHSCLISRAYTLQLALSFSPTITTLSLAIPLQIGVETAFPPQYAMGLPSFESAMAQEGEEAEVDAHLQPRIFRSPDDAHRNDGMLPGYEALRDRTVTVA